MRGGQESNGTVLVFLLLWCAIANSTAVDNPFLVAALCQFNGWVAIKLFSRARFRLQGKAWPLLGKALGCAVLFIVVMPGSDVRGIVYLCGVGLPVLFAAAAIRRFVGEWQAAPEWVQAKAQYAVYAMVLLAAMAQWSAGFSFWHGTWEAVSVGSLVVAAAYFGWRFAEPEGASGSDARFGEAGDFGRSGSSRDV